MAGTVGAKKITYHTIRLWYTKNRFELTVLLPRFLLYFHLTLTKPTPYLFRGICYSDEKYSFFFLFAVLGFCFFNSFLLLSPYKRFLIGERPRRYQVCTNSRYAIRMYIYVCTGLHILMYVRHNSSAGTY